MGYDDPVRQAEEQEQVQIAAERANQCHNGSMKNQGWCPEIWDGILCWPSAAPGTVSTFACPHYIAGFVEGNATRECMPDGNWFWYSLTNATWSNYTKCYTDRYVTIVMNVSDTSNETTVLFEKYVPVVKTITVVGCSVSLSTLIVAFCILAAIKKLRCSRNMLHMQLFASFIARAFIALLKHSIFIHGVGLSSDVRVSGGTSYWVPSEADSNWQCKAFTSLWQYFILANYSWILMEGLYLHNLVFFALFTDSNSSIAGYVVLGWGLPAIFIIPWIAVRAAVEDTLCWTTNNNDLIFSLIRVPTMISILINFVLFINIVRVLFIKLKSTVTEETQRYKRWARSTLVLVPLFGVHYTVFLAMSYGIGGNETVEIVWLICDQLFASFQGFFVAVLYCFLNGEVRAELSRAWRGRRWPRMRSGRWGPRSSIHSCSTCSCNAVKLNEKRTVTKWWNEPLTTCCYRRDNVDRSTHSMASTQAVGTRGGSLASSRGYLEVAGAGNPDHTNHISPLCSKYTGQSLLSFCSNLSEMSGCGNPQQQQQQQQQHQQQQQQQRQQQEKTDKIRDQHRWSDSECSHLAYELHNLQSNAHP